MFASGQYEANMGQKSNEVSGKAVDARQRQGDTANYHFIDRFADSIRFLGRILIDLIPKVYDVPRVVKILSLDGTQSTVQIDPQHANAHSALQDESDDNYNPQQVTAIFNPQVGSYAVEADIGPAFSTRRQEAFNAFSQILQGNPQLVAVAGDLMFKAADFPMADEIAERLSNMVPPQAKGGKPDPQIAQLQQLLAQQHMVLQQANAKLQEAQQKQAYDALKAQNDIYKAETDRMKAINAIDPAALKPIVRSLVSEVLGQPANPVIAAHQLEDAMMHDPNQMSPQQAAMMAHAQAAGTAAGQPPVLQGQGNEKAL